MLYHRELFFARAALDQSTQFIAPDVPARGVAAASRGGFYLTSFVLRASARLNKLHDLYLVLQPLIAPLVPGLFIRFELQTTIVHVLAPPTVSTLFFNYPVPFPWPLTVTERVLLDDGSGRTWPPDTFKATDLISLKLLRDGPHVSDTFPNTVKIAESLVLQGQENPC